jgi:hypothetical protein
MRTGNSTVGAKRHRNVISPEIVVAKHGEATEARRHLTEQARQRLDVAGVERDVVAAKQEQVGLQPCEGRAGIGDRPRVGGRPGVKVRREGDPQWRERG